MRFISEFIITIKKGLLPQLIFDIYKSGCEVYNLKYIEDVEGDEKYTFEVVYSDRDNFLYFVNNLDNFPDKYKVLSVANALEEKIKGGLLVTSGKLPLETPTDYEIGLLGASGLILNKIRKGAGIDYSGISRSIGVMGCIKRFDPGVTEHDLEVYLLCERDSVIISSLTGYSPVPLIVNFDQPEDMIRTFQMIHKSFSGIRLVHMDETNLTTYEQIYVNTGVPVVSQIFDDIPLAMLSILGKLLSKNRLKAGEITVGIIGINISVMRITRMLLETGYYRILGYDHSDSMMLTFENSGGLATTTENIVMNADIIILVKNFHESAGLSKARPGQYIITMPNITDVDEKQIRSRGIRELIRVDDTNFSALYPGILTGLIQSGGSSLDDAAVIRISSKLSRLVSDNYQFPDIFSGIHTKISEFIAGK